MKETICGVLSIPYLDKVVIEVSRGTDRFHVPTRRIYSARYSEPQKVHRLVRRFLLLNSLIQSYIIQSRIYNWNKENGE